MLESHEIQNKIIFEVTTFSCPSYGKFCNESHRLATLQLETELRNWRSCFLEYVLAQRGYVEALFGWLSKFVAPEIDLHSRSRGANGPPLLVLCHDWLESMNNLPEKPVSYAIKSCAKDVRALWLQQGEEQLQKKKVESMSKEFDKRSVAFHKVENRMLELTLNGESAGPETGPSPVVEGKDTLESLRRRLEFEKEKHRRLMQETERMTLNGFQTGFCRVFESMMEFSKAACKMYNELREVERDEKQSCIEEGREVEGNGRRR